MRHSNGCAERRRHRGATAPPQKCAYAGSSAGASRGLRRGGCRYKPSATNAGLRKTGSPKKRVGGVWRFMCASGQERRDAAEGAAGGPRSRCGAGGSERACATALRGAALAGPEAASLLQRLGPKRSPRPGSGAGLTVASTATWSGLRLRPRERTVTPGFPRVLVEPSRRRAQRGPRAAPRPAAGWGKPTPFTGRRARAAWARRAEAGCGAGQRRLRAAAWPPRLLRSPLPVPPPPPRPAVPLAFSQLPLLRVPPPAPVAMTRRSGRRQESVTRPAAPSAAPAPPAVPLMSTRTPTHPQSRPRAGHRTAATAAAGHRAAFPRRVFAGMRFFPSREDSSRRSRSGGGSRESPEPRTTSRRKAGPAAQGQGSSGGCLEKRAGFRRGRLSQQFVPASGKHRAPGPWAWGAWWEATTIILGFTV